MLVREESDARTPSPLSSGFIPYAARASMGVIMRRPPRNKKKVIAVGIAIVVLSAILAAWSSDFRPVSDYCSWIVRCWTDYPYSSDWPVSASDFATAKRLVSARLGWGEYISAVAVPGPDEITVTTTSGPGPGGGHIFTLKRSNGQWKVEVRIRCFDMFWS